MRKTKGASRMVKPEATAVIQVRKRKRGREEVPLVTALEVDRVRADQMSVREKRTSQV